MSRPQKSKYRLKMGIRARVFLDTLFLHPYSVFKHIWKQLAVLSSMIGFGAYVFYYFQKLDPVTALLASVSTISTIGLYAPPITEIPVVEKFLLIGIILTSVGSAASLVQGVVNSVVKTDLWLDEVQKSKVKYMKGHIIILGYTHIGKYVAERLITSKRDFCVITRQKENVNELQKHGIPYILSDLSSPIDALSDANVQNAGSIVLTLESDEMNMLYALTAMHLNSKIKTIAINNSEQMYDGLKKAGIDVVVPIYRMIGNVIASATVTGNVIGVIADSSRKLSGMEMVEIEVKECSKIKGMKLKELPFDYIVLIREGKPVKYLNPEEEIKVGDRLLSLVKFDQLVEVEKLIQCKE